MFEHTTPLQTESSGMFAFIISIIFGRHRKSVFGLQKWIHARGKILGPCLQLQNAERDCVLLVTHCEEFSASSCMSALCENSSSALMRMTLMNKVTVPVACHKPWRNRLVAATFYSSRMSTV